MTKRKNKIIGFFAVLLISIMCFGLSACGSDEPGPLSVAEGTTVSVSVGADLKTVLSNVTLSYDSPDGDESKDFSEQGLENIRAKGVIVQWTGSTQKLADDGTKCKITFHYLGYSCSIDYIVGGGSNQNP